jgi:enterochelin esterase-like enzyme
MLVVMDRGYAQRAGTSQPIGGSSAWLQDVHAAFTSFEDLVVHDLIPMIDASYRTIPDRQHRAMAGLSMGGMQTLFITLQHLDSFAYIGSFSGPIIPALNTGTLTVNSVPEPFDTKTAYGGAFADPSAFNKRVKLLWLGVGSAESEQFRTSISGAVEALRKAGVHLEYFESSGTAHEWQTWRRDLNDFAPRLFR